MLKEFNPQRLDVQAFAEEGAELKGSSPLAELPRLAQELARRDPSVLVHWRAQGELLNPHHVQPQVWLHLQADTVLPLTCQRCLLPVDTPVAFARAFRFVADESTAEAEDEEAEEDVLALSRAFDLPGLLEDELLLALPLVPRHEVCPEPVKLSAVDPDFEAEPERPNPFAVLGRLKDGKS